MALASTTVWEVRTAGSDTNGGGYDSTTLSATDYSQQNAAQYAVTDAVTTGTTTITSATGGFTNAMRGNVLYIAGGTGAITAGWYQVATFVNATTITVDRATGLTAGTGATLNLGGALATIGKLVPIMVVENTAYVKGGTYSISTGISFTQGSFTGSGTGVIGYTTTRGDNGRPIIQASANIDMITISGDLFYFQNFELDGNSTTTRGLVQSSALPWPCINLVIHHCNSGGVFSAAKVQLTKCEVYSCGGANGAIEAASILMCTNVYSHDNTKTGFYAADQLAVLINCISESNSGASSRGFHVFYNNVIQNCIAYNNGSDGFRLQYYIGTYIQNCIATNNGARGLVFVTSAASKLSPNIINCAFYNNTSGSTQGFLRDASNVILSGDPFVDAPNGNFALNGTSGAGLDCKATGFPGAFVGGLSTGSMSIGTIQPNPSASGGGSMIGDGLVSVV